MEKRIILFFLVSMAVVFLWNTLLFPPPPPPPPETPAETLPETGEPTGGPEETAAALPEPEAPQAALAAETEVQTRINTDRYSLLLTNIGARAFYWRLIDYADAEGEAFDLVPPVVQQAFEQERRRFRQGTTGTAALGRAILPLQVALEDAALAERINGALFTVEKTRGENGAQVVTYGWRDADGLAVTKRLTFPPDAYHVELDVSVTRRGRPLDFQVLFGPGLGTHNPIDLKNQMYVGGRGVGWERGKLRHYEAKKAGRQEGTFQWGGIEDNYFAALFLTPTSALVVRDTGRFETELEKTALLAAGPELSDPSGPFTLFVGPKRMTTLEEYGLQEVVDFGIFGFFSEILLHGLNFFYRYIPNYGIAILLVTLVIRILFFPLIFRTMLRMRDFQERMKKIQPRVEAINQRFKKHRREPDSFQRKQREMMALYQKEGINPAQQISGCLPLLLQLPILWGFFQLLPHAIELRQAPFGGWIQDLSQRDPYYITPLLMGVTMFFSTRQSMVTMNDPKQKIILLMMPVMLTFVSIQFPAGLVVYWTFSNVLQMVQQALINRTHENRKQEAQQASRAKRKRRSVP